MKSFRKEFLLLVRSPLSIILFILTPIISFLWYFLILKPFINDSVMYREILSIFPLILSLITPLFTQGLWYDIRANGLEGYYRSSRESLYRIFFEKCLLYFFYYFLLTLTVLPIIIALNSFADIDFLKVTSIYFGISLFILFSVAVGFFVSVLLKGRVLIYFINILILLLSTIAFSGLIQEFNSGLIRVRTISMILILSIGLFFISISIIKREFNIKKYIILIPFLALSLTSIEFDLTINNKNSISQESRDIVERGRVPVSLEYYSNSSIPGIEDVLKRFSKLDNLNYRKTTKGELDSGVKAFKPLELGEGSGLYSFIVIEYLTRFRVIPIVTVTETLEYEIIREIDFLINGSLDSVAILIGDDNYNKEDFYLLEQSLISDFHIEFVSSKEIPYYIDTLFIIGVKDVDNLDYIGEFLSRGGNLFIAGNGVDTNSNLDVIDSPLLNSLKSLGISIEPYLVGDNNNIGWIEDGQLIPYPLNVKTRANFKIGMNPLIYPFSGFNAIYFSPVVSRLPDSKSLLKSSKESWLVNKESQNIDVGTYYGATYAEGSFSSLFSGSGEGNNRILVLGNLVSLTNTAVEIGVVTGFDFIHRALYRLNGRDDLLKVRLKSFEETSLYKLQGDPSFFRLFFLILYPTILLFIFISIRRRFK